MYRSNFLFFTLLICWYNSPGQIVNNVSENDEEELYDIEQITKLPLFASPEAASFEEQAQAKPGFNDGSLELNVPIYTIKTKNLEVPISLSYRSNGIKVNDISTYSGICWKLIAGGAITRTMYGRPDEAGLRLNFDTVDWNNPNSALWAAHTLSDNNYDGQNDLFSYTYPEGSGSFAYTQEWEPFMIPKKNIDITIIRENGEINGFILRDEKGIKYRYSSIETTFHPPLV